MLIILALARSSAPWYKLSKWNIHDLNFSMLLVFERMQPSDTIVFLVTSRFVMCGFQERHFDEVAASSSSREHASNFEFFWLSWCSYLLTFYMIKIFWLPKEVFKDAIRKTKPRGVKTGDPFASPRKKFVRGQMPSPVSINLNSKRSSGSATSASSDAMPRVALSPTQEHLIAPSEYRYHDEHSGNLTPRVPSTASKRGSDSLRPPSPDNSTLASISTNSSKPLIMRARSVESSVGSSRGSISDASLPQV